MSETEALINSRQSEHHISWSFQRVYEYFIQPCIAEFVGVAMFVFIGTTVICSGTGSSGGIVTVALAHGLAIALLVIATGTISGGHLNPAVTLGVLIAGAINPVQAVLYVASQLIGGILGAAFTLGVVGHTSYNGECAGGSHQLPANTLPGQAVLCEILLTYLLVTTVLLAGVDNSSKNSLCPVAVGFTVTVDILAGGPVSGASMNPARSFGPAVVIDKSDVWMYHWIYWVGPIIGSIMAGIIYRLFLAGRDKRVIESIYYTLK